MLHVYITFDVDPDNVNTTSERTRITWHGIEMVPKIHDELMAREIPYTFFVRMDNQIHDLFGDYLGIYRKHADLWSGLRSSGNELGWHPHLYERQNGQYIPLRRPGECAKILLDVWQEIKLLDFPITSVRIGEAWHSTETMRTVNALGLQVDSTGIPGRFRNDAARKFDWAPTPNKPYHPSKTDYRVSSEEDHLEILEVPMTTYAIKTSYDRAPVPRYLNLTYHEDFFRQGIQGFTAELSNDQANHMVIIFHPDELLPRRPNDLHMFGLDSFNRNLDILQECLHNREFDVKFCRLNEAFL